MEKSVVFCVSKHSKDVSLCQRSFLIISNVDHHFSLRLKSESSNSIKATVKLVMELLAAGLFARGLLSATLAPPCGSFDDPTKKEIPRKSPYSFLFFIKEAHIVNVSLDMWGASRILLGLISKLPSQGAFTPIRSNCKVIRTVCNKRKATAF